MSHYVTQLLNTFKSIVIACILGQTVGIYLNIIKEHAHVSSLRGLCFSQTFILLYCMTKIHISSKVVAFLTNELSYKLVYKFQV